MRHGQWLKAGSGSLPERLRRVAGWPGPNRLTDAAGVSAVLLGVVLAILVAPVVARAAGQAGEVPSWWLALVGLPLATSVLLALAGRGRGASVLVWAGTCLAMLTMPLVLEHRLVGEPWPLMLLSAVSAATVLVSPRRRWTDVVLMVVLLGAGAVCRLEAQVDPDPRILLDDSVYAVAIWAVTGLLHRTLTTAADRVQQVHADAVHEFARARAAEATVRSAQAWDSYVHDEVIAALATISGGGGTAAARTAARRIVAGSSELDDGSIIAPSLTDGALESVLQLLPSADTDFTVEDGSVRLPCEVRRALLEALSEALRNVDRHAHPDGTSGRTVVRLRHDGHGAEVRITDDGVGFDIDRVDPSRLGLAISVQSRMDSVGGSARIVSRPGLGTSVVLRWPVSEAGARTSRQAGRRLPWPGPAARSAAAPTDGWDRTDRKHDMRRSALLASVVWVGVSAVVGLTILDFASRPLVFGPLLLLLAVGSALGTRPLWDPAREGRRESVVELLLVAVAVPLVAFVVISSRPGMVVEHANWTSGAVGVMLAALALRAGFWCAEASAVATLVIEVLLHATGSVPMTPAAVVALAAPTQMWVVGTWAAGRYLRRTDELASGFRARSALESAERQAADGWALMRKRRVGDLEGEVLPLMRAVVDLAPDRDVPEDLRRRSRELAEALRDSLLARSLMIPELRTSVRSARSRGVAVMLTSELFHGDRVASLRQLIDALLQLPGLTSITVRALEERGEQAAEAIALLGGAFDEDDVVSLVTELPGGGWGGSDLVRMEQELMVRLVGR